MLRRFPAWMLLAGLAALAAPAASAPAGKARLDAFCRRLDTAWAGVRSYQANLKWPNPESRKPEEQGCGVFIFQRPGKWLMEFHTPNFEKYMVREDTGFVYIDKLKQGMRYHLGPEDRAQVGVLVLGQSTADLSRFYDLSMDPTPADRAAVKARGPGLVLVPRAGGSLALRRAVVFVDPATYLPVRVRMQMEGGAELNMTLYAAQKNQAVHPSVWNFVLPEHATLVDR